METRILHINNDNDLEAMTTAAEALRLGKLVAFPTETVYGIGANALDVSVVKRIYEPKADLQITL